MLYKEGTGDPGTKTPRPFAHAASARASMRACVCHKRACVRRYSTEYTSLAACVTVRVHVACDARYVAGYQGRYGAFTMEQLLSMGFQADAARTALAQSGQNVQLAVAQLTGDEHEPQLHSSNVTTDEADMAPATDLGERESSAGGQLRRWFSGLLSPSSTPVYLLACSHGGSGALTGRGQMYEVPPNSKIPAGGRGQALTLGPKESGLVFVFDGNISSGAAVRINSDPTLALEVNWRKYEVDNSVSLWGSGDPSHAAWAQRFVLNSDYTMSPVGRLMGPQIPGGLVLGVEQQGSQLILVRQDDTARRVVFCNADMMASAVADLGRQQRVAAARLQAQARAICSEAFKADLQRDGFVHVPQAVSSALVRRARQEINRAIGASSSSADAFKAKVFATEPAITDLFNRSVVPLLCRELLGDMNDGDATSVAAAHYKQHAGQLALRFPGDLCEDGGCECSPEHFQNIRARWHIDGLPSDFIPGKTDHYGTIHNFDLLCGVLLSNVDEPLSGELCCYRGSHSRLAKHIAQTGLDRLYTEGNAALPTGPQTDALFGPEAHKQVHHCIGKAGDVFLANYMTAHFVAPNTCPDIRYAVYFRVHGLAFDRENPVHQSASMINPWIHWFGLNGLSKADARAVQAAGRGQGAAGRQAGPTDVDFHLSADNVAAALTASQQPAQ